MDLKYDRSLHEKEHKSGPFQVTAGIIEKVDTSLGNPCPTTPFAGGTVTASPTLCSIFMRDVDLPDIGLDFGRTRVHAGHRIQPKAPIFVGDQLAASSHLKEVYAKTGRSGTMVFVVWETTFRNQDGNVVAEIQDSFASRE